MDFMTKLERNALHALRIAELMGWISNDEGAENTFVQVYSSYNGLMPIVFECNSVFASNVSHEIEIFF